MGGPGSMRMGYVEVETRPGCPLFPAGTHVRGHVFHFSEIVQVGLACRLAAHGLLAAWRAWVDC